jgi:uncharacterized membrane protein required for colicin V production
MIFWVFYFIVVFAGLAMMVREGLWSNTISLFTIIVAGLIAFGFYSPLVVYLNEELTDGQHTYWLDFAVIWALYFVSMIILRVFTGAASKTRMRFKHPIDPVGGPLMGLVAAWVLAAFTLATLHVSPMPKDAFGGKLASFGEVSTSSFITAPDAAWLRFIERMSKANAISSSNTEEFTASNWVSFYSKRREAFENSKDFIVTRKKS